MPCRRNREWKKKHYYIHPENPKYTAELQVFRYIYEQDVESINSGWIGRNMQKSFLIKAKELQAIKNVSVER